MITAVAGQDMKARAPATGNTPLHLAVVDGKEAAGVLVMAGANVNALNSKNDTPLSLWPSGGGHVRFAKDLLFSGANPDRRLKGQNPIHIAAYHGLDEVARALALKGANPDCLDFAI